MLEKRLTTRLQDAVRKPLLPLLQWLTGASSLSELSPARLTWRLLLISSVLMAVGVYVGTQPILAEPGWIFREGKPMTWMSVFQLAGAGYICHRIWLLRREGPVLRWNHGSALWRVFAIGFMFLAADELLRIHETTDRYLHKMIGADPGGWSDGLDDVIIGIYGVIGLYFLVRYRHELFRYRRGWLYLALGMVTTALSIVLDLLSGSRELSSLLVATPEAVHALQAWCAVAEEVLKIYAEVFLLGTFAACHALACHAGTDRPASAAEPGAALPLTSDQPA